MAAMQAAPQGGGVEAFSFGDPVPVMDGQRLCPTDYKSGVASTGSEK